MLDNDARYIVTTFRCRYDEYVDSIDCIYQNERTFSMGSLTGQSTPCMDTRLFLAVI